MKIATRAFDIEAWTVRDFTTYIFRLLHEYNIECTSDLKRDSMIMGTLFKRLRMAGKSKTYLKHCIDKAFPQFTQTTVKKVSSLSFINQFVDLPSVHLSYKPLKKQYEAPRELSDNVLYELSLLRKNLKYAK